MGIISSLNKKNIFDRVQMNKFTFVAVLFLVNAAFATSFLKSGANSPIFAQLKKVEETSFGKNLLDTIALQVQNQAPLSDISRLLANLKADLEKQQAEADQLQAEREEECEKAIAEYNRRIEVANTIIAETTEKIAKLVKVIKPPKPRLPTLKEISKKPENNFNLPEMLMPLPEKNSPSDNTNSMVSSMLLTLSSRSSFPKETSPKLNWNSKQPSSPSARSERATPSLLWPKLPPPSPRKTGKELSKLCKP